MEDTSNSDKPTGWEFIWRNKEIPHRYQNFAPPNATVVEWAETLPPGGFVLDVGCGAGRHVIFLGGRGFRLAGVDIAPSGIQRAQEACAEHQISFDGRVSDMMTLPWADGTFDAALSTSTIHHLIRTDIVQALNEVRRVLKPGGLFLVDFPSTERPLYQELRQQADAGDINEVEPNTFVDERPQSEDSDGYLPHHYCDEADARDLLRSFDILRLWTPLSESGQVTQWVGWVRKPLE